MNDLWQFIAWSLPVVLLIWILRRASKKKSRMQVIVSTGQVSGFLLWQWIDRIVDYVVYPAAILAFGVWWGGLIMIVFTLIGNMIYIHVNNNTDEDWTFFKWLIELRDKRTFVWINHYDHLLKKVVHLPGKFLRRLVICWCALVRQLLRIRFGKFKFSNGVAFVLLSVFRDSFQTTTYFFHKKADLRNPRVMSVFLVSHVICNAAWLPVAGLIGVVGNHIFRLFSLQF